MIIKTNVPAWKWFREFKAQVEPTLTGVSFSTFSVKRVDEYIQVHISGDGLSENDKKELFFQSLKSSDNQPWLDYLTKYIVDQFGYNIPKMKVYKE